MLIDEIKRVCFIGSGTIGCWNALAISTAGYESVVYDVSEEMLASAPDRLRETAQQAVMSGLFTEDAVAQGMQRISFTSSVEQATTNIELLIESVPEILKLKRQVHKKFDEICSPEVIFTTNSSSLLVSEIEDAVKRRDKFAALHFHLQGRLVDIVAGPETDPRVIDILKRFTRSIDQVPVVHTKEKDGFLYNTLLIMHLKTAVMLVVDGYGTFENVDRSWMAAKNEPFGPIAILDLVGIDLVRDIFQAKYERSADQDFKRAADFLGSKVERGEKGMKAGKGFYTYPDAAWQQPGFLSGD